MDCKPPLLARAALRVLLPALAATALPLPAGALADQASQPGSPAAATIDAGRDHACALLPGGSVRCWGYGGEGRLGYGNTATIGDDETPAAAGPVDLGPGRTAVAISVGDFHNCALLDNGTVRCWGFGGNGRLGYGNLDHVGDNEAPGSVGPVDLGPGRTAKAISAGGAHTCAVLDDDSLLCWGFAFWGQLGYGNPPAGPGGEPPPVDIGDNETPGSAGPVDLGSGVGVAAVSAGVLHTCAVRDDGHVQCWGNGLNGRLGYGNTSNVGDRDPPASAGTLDLGPGRTATAIGAGNAHTCAVLDDASVRCWGFGGNGRLGYGNFTSIGDDEAPAAAGPVNIGAGRTAAAVGASDSTTCAVLDDGSVRCWGFGGNGRLGYGNTADVGDDELPGAVGPVDLGAGRSAAAVGLGGRHTCARLDDGNVRCWGYGSNGRLGYCGVDDVGDNEPPGSRGPVDLGVPGSGAAGCPAPPAPARRPYPAPRPPAAPAAPDDGLAAQARRARALRSCRRRATRHARREVRRARRLSGARRARLRRHARRHRKLLRKRCLKRHARTPGRIRALSARATSRRRIVLTFLAPGTDRAKPPPARAYLVKQSRRRIRGSRGFRRARTLCRGSCRVSGISRVGARIAITITGLRPGTRYHYAIAARDNVSRRLGRRSRTVAVRTRR